MIHQNRANTQKYISQMAYIWVIFAALALLFMPLSAVMADVTANQQHKATEQRDASSAVSSPKAPAATRPALPRIAPKPAPASKPAASAPQASSRPTTMRAEQSPRSKPDMPLPRQIAAVPDVQDPNGTKEITTPSSVFSHAILLNGGENAQINYYSHVLYLRMMRQVLLDLGLSDSSINILSSDGDDPAPDQAILLERKRPEHWLFAYRPEYKFFPHQPTLINTEIEGQKIMPAKLDVMKELFGKLSKSLTGDLRPLVLFVTDHGTRNKKEPSDRNNFISLWHENLSVQQLHQIMRPFERRRVISIMSQCFSGSFFWSVFRRSGVFGVPFGDRCGFYATLPNEYAYGCFPETQLKKNVGHAYHFIEAMRRAKTFNDAHREVLLTDLTPDIPIRSSDGYLYALIQTDAKADNISPETLIEQIFTRFKDRSYPGMDEDLELIGDIAKRFGLARPLDINALKTQREAIKKQKEWWQQVEQMWREVYASARDYHLGQVYRAFPDIWEQVRPLMQKEPQFFEKLHKDLQHKQSQPPTPGTPQPKLGSILHRQKHTIALSSASDIAAHKTLEPLCSPTRPAPKIPHEKPTVPPPAMPPQVSPSPNQAPTHQHQHGQQPPPPPAHQHQHGQRPEIPKPKVEWPPEKTISMVRSEFLTYVQARPQLLARLGSLYQQRENMAQYVFMLQVRMAAIQRMEILFYRVAGRLLLEHDNHPEFQAYREGVKRLLDCEATPLRTQPDKAEPALKLEPISFDDSHPPLPSWFGVTFRPVLPKQRGALPTGSVEIESVYLDTPAGAAGIQSGDIVVAVDGKQLHEPFEIRERVMLAKSDQPTLMHILRDGKIHIRKVPLRRLVEPPSMKLPPLIGRDVSSFAPARIVDTDQPVPFSKHKTYLISFWTTWCGPCKATFPDLRRWQEQYGIDKLQVVNISNEPRITVKNWIDKHRAEVPFINAYDPERVTLFRQYQVPGTPTFVLIQNGKIRHIHIGFLRLENLKKAIDKVFAEDK